LEAALLVSPAMMILTPAGACRRSGVAGTSKESDLRHRLMWLRRSRPKCLSSASRVIKVAASELHAVAADEHSDRLPVGELLEVEEVMLLANRGRQLGLLTCAQDRRGDRRAGCRRRGCRGLHDFPERAEIDVGRGARHGSAITDVERALDNRGRRHSRTPLDLKPETTPDSLQLFLKNIGTNGLGPAGAQTTPRPRVIRTALPLHHNQAGIPPTTWR
jgi:hypothetical protein